MRILLAVFAVAAAAAAAWLLLSAGGSATSDWTPGVPSGPSTADGARRPAPRGAEADSADPETATGSTALHGRVTRDGDPVAATVHATWLRDWDPRRRPSRMTLESSFDWLLPPPPSTGAERTAKADAEGEYRFESLRRGVYRVEAVGPAGASVTRSLNLSDRFGEGELDFELPAATESLSGRAVYEDGRPFRGTVTIQRVLDERRHDSPLRGVKTGADGSFALTGLPPGPVVLLAIEDRFTTYRGHRVELPAAKEIVYVVDEGVEDVTGRVVASHDGSPIAGARLVVGGGEGDRHVTDHALSGEDGSFTVRVDPELRWIFAEADGYAPVWLYQGGIGPDPVVRLDRYGRITGRVTGPDGAPIAGLSVFAVPTDRRRSGDRSVAQTGSDGRFEIRDALPGDLSVVAGGEGFVSPGIADLTSDGYNPFLVHLEPGGEAVVDLEVVRAGAVAGRVVNDGGEPAAGVPVRVRTAQNRSVLLAFLEPDRAATDEAGRFLIGDLVPGVEISVRAEPGDRGPSPEVRVEVASGETAEVELRLPPRRQLLVRVREKETGAPIPAAVVQVQLREGDSVRGAGVGSVKTNSDGEAVIGRLPTGELSVRVSHDDHIDLPEGVAVPGSEGDAAELEVEIALEKGLAVRGLVLAPDGIPVNGARVIARSTGFTRHHVWESAVTDGEGRFRIGGLPEGSYGIQTVQDREGKRYEAERIVSAGGDEVVLRLAIRREAERERLRVRVVDPEGRPVRSGSYRFGQRGNGGSSTGGSNLRNGAFEETVNRRYETMWIHLWDVRAADGTRLAPLVHGPVPIRSGELELALSPGEEVSGRVIDDAGDPVRGVKLRVVPALADSLSERDQEHATAFSGADGAYTLEGLGDFDYTIHADVPPEYAPVPPVPVRPGARDVVIRLAPGRAVELLVLGWNDEPAERVRVSARPAQGTPGAAVDATTDDEGVALLEGLDPGGVYALDLRPPPERKDLLRREVADWRPADARFRLERAFVVRGTVRDPGGNPVPDAMVWRKTGETSWRGGETGADGTFEFEGLPAGDVVLRVSVGNAMGFSGADAENITVAAGTENLVITVDPGRPLKLLFVDAPADARFFLVQVVEESGENPKTHRAFHRGGETMEITGLDPAKTFAVHVTLHRGGGVDRIGYARGAVPGGPEVEVRFAPPLALRGRVNLPEGAEHARVVATGPGFGQGGEIAPDGSFEIDGLPPGPVAVRATAWDGETLWQATATAEAGGEIELDLKPEAGSEGR